jgi:CRP/FNR family transcriptional regulator
MIPLLAERTTIVAQVPLLAGLSPAEVAAVVQHATERRFEAGETLFAEGDRCEGLHLILRGRVKVAKTSPTGREIMLHIESAPASVAEVPLFDDGPYPATAYAVEPTIALLLRRADFRRLCLLHPDIPLKMLAVLGARLRQLVGLIDSLTFGGVRQRLARLLLDCRTSARDDTFDLPATIQEIAMRLGTAREVVSRNLSRFQAHGLIRLHKGEVVILDHNGLLREAESEY